MNEFRNSKDKFFIVRIISYLFLSVLINIFLVYIYNFEPNFNTFLFMILIPLMIAPFFISKDLMHPFNIFFITSQFLFVFNMIDLNANKESFKYGILNNAYHDTAFSWAIFIIIIWYTFMYLGYGITKIIEPSIFNKKSIEKTSFEIKNPNTIAMVLAFVGLISYMYILSLQGGLSGIILSLSNRRESYAGLGYFIELTGLFSIAAIILLGKGYKKISLVMIIVSFLMIASFGGRGAAFFGSVFPYLVFYHYRIKRLKVMQLIPLAIIAIIFAIGLGNYRLYQETRIDFSGLYEMISKIASGTEGGEILPSLVGSLIKGIVDYQYGSTLVNIIFAPVPRTLWSDKPQIDESGIVGYVLIGSDFWGLPPGPYGISFFNFGFIGVILIAFITGVIIRKLYYSFVLAMSRNIYGLIFYVLTIRLIFNLTSTSAQISIIFYLVIFFLIKFFDILISTIKNKRYQKIELSHSRGF